MNEFGCHKCTTEFLRSDKTARRYVFQNKTSTNSVSYAYENGKNFSARKNKYLHDYLNVNVYEKNPNYTSGRKIRMRKIINVVFVILMNPEGFSWKTKGFTSSKSLKVTLCKRKIFFNFVYNNKWCLWEIVKSFLKNWLLRPLGICKIEKCQNSSKPMNFMAVVLYNFVLVNRSMAFDCM